MLVSDVVKTALILVGRKDAADAVDTQSYLQDTSLSHAVNAMLHCYNAVEDELARGFFPLETEQNFNTINGTVKFASFTHAPIKIVSVVSDGKRWATAYIPNIWTRMQNTLRSGTCIVP